MSWSLTRIPFEKGSLLLIKNQKGLQSIKYGQNQSSIDLILDQYNKSYVPLVWNEKAFELESELFKQYFQGKPVDFTPLKLDFSSATIFQKNIWSITRKIPYGRVETYKSVAQKINHKGYRSVGRALGRNSYLIAVPCHRVIRTNGDLGGFGSGLPLKKYLLYLEGIKQSEM